MILGQKVHSSVVQMPTSIFTCQPQLAVRSPGVLQSAAIFGLAVRVKRAISMHSEHGDHWQMNCNLPGQRT
jgi:hypothetical protein